MSVSSWLDRLVLDVRHTLRTLARAPVFTSVAVLSIALGIGANTAIFSILHALLLRPLPVPSPQELVQVTFGRNSTTVTNPIWEYLRERQDVLASSFAWARTRFDLSVGGGKQPIAGLYASGDFFDSLGVRAVIGRTLDRADDRRGGGAHGPVAVISYRYWQTRHRGSPEVLGSPIRLDGHIFTIVGVAAPDFTGLDVGFPFDVAVPIATEAILRGKDSMLDGRGVYWLKVAGRLKSEQPLAQAQAGLRALMPGLRDAMAMQAGRSGAARPNRFLAQELSLYPAATGARGLQGRYQPILLALMGTVALVLLIACANLANLLLARASARQRELAVRLALGASRGRLLGQFLIESLCLAIAGAALGLLFAQGAARLVITQIATPRAPMALDVSLDWPVLLFAAGLALATALLFGLVPALRSTDLDASDALKRQGRSIAGGWRGVTAEKLLVGAQVAVSLVLVFGALLFVRTFATLATLDAGFDRRQVLIATIDASRTAAAAAGSQAGARQLGAARPGAVRAEAVRAGTAQTGRGQAGAAQAGAGQSAPAGAATRRSDAGRSEAEARAAIYAQVLDAARGLPGVQYASMSLVTPISGDAWSAYIEVDGFTPERNADAEAHFNRVSPGYFRTLGTPLLTGRDFDARDTRAAPEVAIVNEAFVRQFFRGAGRTDGARRDNGRGEGGRHEAARSGAGDGDAGRHEWADRIVGRTYRGRGDKPFVQIVGVVKDSKYRSLRDRVPPTAYVPLAQDRDSPGDLSLLLRTAADATTMVRGVTEIARQIEPTVRLEFSTLQAQVDDSLAQERLIALLSGFFGVLALLVAGLGLYGVMSLAVSRRRHEIGIRMALGAVPASVVRLVVRDVLIVTAIGLTVGAIAGLSSGRLIASLLFGLAPTDLTTWLVAVAVLGAVAAGAGYLPARRAAGVDPMHALRDE